MKTRRGTILSAAAALLLLPHLASAQQPPPPPSGDDAAAALQASPRHGEWVDVAVPGTDREILTWVVYPERSGPAPVVVVIHEIYGMSDWIRTVADQLAAEGYIALAPDLLSGKGPRGGGTAELGDQVGRVIRELTTEEVTSALNAVRDYGLGLPASGSTSACIGFCWGGSTSFEYAIRQPGLDAAVVYYGTSPSDAASYASIGAPVLGLYGGDDNRVNATIPQAEEATRQHSKSYEPNIYPGAGHGFLRAQSGRDGANMEAARQAWARMIAFLRTHLGS